MINIKKGKLSMNRLRHLVLSITLLLGSFAPAAVTVGTAYAQTGRDAICAGVNTETGGTATCNGAGAGTAISNVIRVALRIFQAIIGVISIFVMLLAGLNYIMSGGDSGKTKTAKDRILYATIGLVVVGLAEVIIAFVINRINESNAPAVPAAAAPGP